MHRREFTVVQWFVALMLVAFACVPKAADASNTWRLEVIKGGTVLEVQGGAADVAGEPYVALRVLTDYFGASIGWLGDLKEATVEIGPTKAVFRVGEARAVVNRSDLDLSLPPVMVGGRVMVAAHDLTVLDLSVSVEPATRLVRVGPNKVKVLGLSWSFDDGRGALAIQADSNFEYNSFVLSSPDRLVIDVLESEPGPGLKNLEVGDDIVRRIRAAVNRPGVVRVVLDLTKSTGFTLSYEPGRPARLLVRFNTRISAIGVEESPAAGRVVVQASGRFVFRQPREGADGTYYIDIPDATLMAECVDLPAGRHGVEWLRAGQFDPSTVRVVMKLRDGLVPHPRFSLSDQTRLMVDLSYVLSDVRVRSERGRTLVEFETSGPVDFRVFRLIKPDRIVIDMPGAAPGAVRVLDVGSRSVQRIRAAQFTMEVGRAVVDLSHYWRHSFDISSDRRTLRLQVDESPLYQRSIMLDPGHGGTDPGAVRNGLLEKDINLDIALRLRDLLSASGAHVSMTREDDSTVELADRAKLANGLMPDVFLSIHCNAVWNVFPCGTETYYYNMVPYSQELAVLVHNSLLREIELMDRKVQRKNFLVVRETEVPSALVEVAFISNDVEATKLRDPAFRQKAAVGLHNGLLLYFGGEMFERWENRAQGPGAPVQASPLPAQAPPTPLPEIPPLPAPAPVLEPLPDPEPGPDMPSAAERGPADAGSPPAQPESEPSPSEPPPPSPEAQLVSEGPMPGDAVPGDAIPGDTLQAQPEPENPPVADAKGI
ncbi:MAG: N-acetylmuramoyl-L-alanine amidase [Firmicutes bacterium]|nr:N-acetylmuramoyl-L-alanine amidase [Bacillota bacterium]